MTVNYNNFFLTYDENGKQVTKSIHDVSLESGISEITIYNRFRARQRGTCKWNDYEIGFKPIQDNRVWNKSKKKKRPTISAEARKEKKMFDMRAEFLRGRLV